MGRGVNHFLIVKVIISQWGLSVTTAINGVMVNAMLYPFLWEATTIHRVFRMTLPFAFPPTASKSQRLLGFCLFAAAQVGRVLCVPAAIS